MPPVMDVLAEVLKEFPEVTETEGWTEAIDRFTPVLVLGTMPPIEPIRYVKTLSQKQILSNPAAITELKVAIRNLLTPPVYPPLEYSVVDGLTSEEEEDLGDILVVDIETGGNYDKLLPREMYLLSVGINDGKNIYVFTEESLQEDTTDNAREQLRRILSKPGRKLVAHNMKFDFPTVGGMLGVELYGHLDTLLLFHSINHGGKDFGLKDMARRLLGAPDWDAAAKQYTRKTKDYASIPRELLYTYNAYDVYWDWYLMVFLIRAAEAEARIAGVARHEFQMSRFFQDVEGNGAAVDVEYLAELKAEYDAAEIPLLTEIRELTWPEYNYGSWQQVKKHLQDWNIQVKSTDEKTLTALKLEKGSELYRWRELQLELRGIQKMRGTYVEGIQKRMRGNIVYPSFLVHGTTTGRLSSRDPNIQNIPRDPKLRKIFVTRAPGRTVVEVDYSQAELRVMAVLSGDEYLMSLFQKGSPDFFDAMMPSAFPHEDIASWGKTAQKNNRAKLKAVVYGLAYNRQAPAIAEELKMSVKEAQTIINNFLKAAPQFAQWRQKIMAQALDPDAFIVSPFGRQYQVEVVTGKNKQNVINSALAFLPQSTASDLCVIAAQNVHGRLHSGQYGDSMIFATVHDAILADVPVEYAESYARMAVEEMERSAQMKFGNIVHFAAEASSGPSWGEQKKLVLAA